MLLILKRTWTVFDASRNQQVAIIGPGRHQVEKITNPLDANYPPWLVVVGTKIGAAETFWKFHTPDEWGDMQVKIEE